jgi:hypothetical protein
MVGALLIKLDRLGVAVLSGFATFSATILVYQALSIQEMSALFAFALCAVTITFFGLGFMWPHFAIIITTSFFGSYLIVRGISFFIGSFPAELLIIKAIIGKGPKSSN